MEIEEAIRTYLLTVPGLVSLIGDKVMPDEVGGGVALPLITYQKISDRKLHTLSGQLAVERPIWQYTVYAATKDAARAIINLLKTAMCDYQGTLSGLVIQKIELQGENASTQRGGTFTAYVEDLEFEITFERS